MSAIATRSRGAATQVYGEDRFFRSLALLIISVTAGLWPKSERIVLNDKQYPPSLRHDPKTPTG